MSLSALSSLVSDEQCLTSLPVNLVGFSPASYFRCNPNDIAHCC